MYDNPYYKENAPQESEQERNEKKENKIEEFKFNLFFIISTGLFGSIIIYNITQQIYSIFAVYSVCLVTCTYMKHKMLSDFDGKNESTNDNTQDSFNSNYYDGESLTEPIKKYPRVGMNTVLTTIEDIYVPEYDNKLHIKLDIPLSSDDGVFKFDYPFAWDASENQDDMGFAYFAEEHGYNKDNFYEMVGSPVAVKIKDGKWNTLVIDKPEKMIKNRLEDDDITHDNIDAEQIIDKFDIELPNNIAVGEEIIMDNNPLKDNQSKDWR
jgi:hypothetical protein